MPQRTLIEWYQLLEKILQQVHGKQKDDCNTTENDESKERITLDAEESGSRVQEHDAAVLYRLLQQRYGQDKELLTERLHVYHNLFRNLIQNASTLQFQLHDPIVCIASPGRDRLFMGHTDFAGLGGFTIDCATQEEILCFAQLTDDGLMHLHNSDHFHFPSWKFPIHELLAIAEDKANYGKRCFSTEDWSGYVKAALTFMLSPHFDRSIEIRNSLLLHEQHSSRVTQEFKDEHIGVRFFISSTGRLALPHTGGVSSSAALTGAISMALSSLLFNPPLTLASLASVDYGEYYLGKFAGAADKMAQLYAGRGLISVISSLPEKYLRSFTFPSDHLRIVIAECQIPRLTISHAREYLEKDRSYTPDHVNKILEHSQSVMFRFGSLVYKESATMLCEKLKVQSECTRVGLTDEESLALLSALQHKASGHSNVKSVYDGPLLREWCHNGSLEVFLPSIAGWGNRMKRYSLIFKALLLLPEKLTYTNEKGTECDLHLRKATLYGLSEVERGWAYLFEIEAISNIEREIQQLHQSEEIALKESLRTDIDSHIRNIINLVSLSHDGDRAVIDYRILKKEGAPNEELNGSLSRHDKYFVSRPWAATSNVQLTDSQVLSHISQGDDLVQTVGSYERSIADIDDVADDLKKTFNSLAAVRISAAGLGGRVCIHCKASLFDDVCNYMINRGWSARQPSCGAPTQQITTDRK